MLICLLLSLWSALLVPTPARSTHLDAAHVAVWDPGKGPIPAMRDWDRIPAKEWRSTGTLNLGAYRPPLLLRIPVRADAPGRWWLVTTLRTPEHLRLRLGEKDLGAFGTGEPFARRISGSYSLTIPLDLRQGTDTLWMLASDPQGDCKLDMDLVPDRLYPSNLQRHGLETGIFLGCVGMMCMMSLYLWSIMKIRTYGWYAGMTCIGWFWIATKSGLPAAWIWPEAPEWNRVWPALLSKCAVGALGFFVIHMLELPRHLPRLSRLLAGLSIALFASGLSMLLSIAAPALHARWHGSLNANVFQVAQLLILAVVVVLRVKARDALALSLSLSLVPLVLAFLYGSIADFVGLGIDRDYDRGVMSLAALVQGILITFVLVREMRRREQVGAALERDFHLKLVDRTDAHSKAVAYELHDDLGQRAAVLRMQVGRLFEQEGLSEAQQELGERIAELVERIRELSHRLNPRDQIGSDLSDALRTLCRDLESSTGIDILFRTEGASQGVPGEVALQLCRICQEALSNAIRHGRARTIEVDLRQESGTVRLDVEDDGCGFDPSTVRKGIGLHSMKDRAIALGASFSLESRPGGPTRVRTVVRRQG